MNVSSFFSRLGKAMLAMLLLAGLVTTSYAAGEKKVALVIGNNAYKNVEPLERATNDAVAVGKELQKLGFEVMSYTNLGYMDMNKKLQEFSEKISGGGVGVIFFAGHGVQINNQNFLLPVDVSVQKPEELRYAALSLSTITDTLADAKAKFAMIVLDACRNDPFPKVAGRSILKTRGLAQASTPDGVLVMYSAGANQQALDSLSPSDRDPNGLFTREFLKQLKTPGVSATDILKNTRTSVREKAKGVGHDQNPALYDQTTGEFFFTNPVSAPRPSNMAQPLSVDPAALELSFWESIKNSDDRSDFKAYLDKYPNGQYAALARNRMAKLEDQDAAKKTRSGDVGVVPTATAVAAAPASGSKAAKIEEMGEIKYLQVSDLRAAKRNGMLAIQAEITNSDSSNRQLYYRFKWLDEAGFSVWDDEPWKPLTIYGKQKQLITVVAPTPRATDFRIVLQSPN